MYKITKQAHKLLLKKRKTIAIAESCTGGLLSSLLTSLSGSSRYFILGVITYSNKTKASILKIPNRIIKKYGAVSAQVGQKMAQNVRKMAQTDFGIGITGIAGPTGATTGKPVGTVFIALSAKNVLTCKKFNFKGSRSAIRKSASFAALKLLNRYV